MKTEVKISYLIPRMHSSKLQISETKIEVRFFGRIFLCQTLLHFTILRQSLMRKNQIEFLSKWM